MEIKLFLEPKDAKRLRDIIHAVRLGIKPALREHDEWILAVVSRRIHRILTYVAGAEGFPLTPRPKPAILQLEHSLSTPEQQANLLTRMALRNGIDASALETAASNIHSLGKIWFNTYLQTTSALARDGVNVEAYRAWRVAAIRALLDESQ